jgi:hypothetical protein
MYLFSTDLPRAAGAVVITLGACIAGNAYWETTTTFKKYVFLKEIFEILGMLMLQMHFKKSVYSHKCSSSKTKKTQ